MNWPPESTALDGSIVRLELLGAQHRDGLARAANDAEIWTWMNRLVPTEQDAFDAWFDARLAASRGGDEWCFATISTATGQPIGSSSYLAIRHEHDGLEIGWTWLDPSTWRTGANLEAKLLMLRQAFDQLGCMRVEFKTDARNERSRTALEGIGATFEGVLRKHMLMPGIGVRDSAYFSITDEEWPDVRAGLEGRLAREPARA